MVRSLGGKCQTPSIRHKRTDGRTDEETRLFVRPLVGWFVPLSLCPLCLSEASIIWGNEHRNLTGGNKYPGSTNKHMKFGQFIIRKIIKIIAAISVYFICSHSKDLHSGAVVGRF